MASSTLPGCIGVKTQRKRGIQMASYTQQALIRSQSLNDLRERLAKQDKHLAKLYRLSRNLGYQIERVQRQRMNLIQRIEAEEVRHGTRD